jgi:site-specific DNA-methyltransferase (adenine-specific)
VTDPPYGIDFLGKAWDANTGALETYQECLRVLKPGGHILAFSAARTYHHLAVTLEQAGFEIRDQIMWIYSSGFPKSQNVGKMIDSQILTGSAHTSSQRKMAMGKDYTAAGHYTVFSADKDSDLAEASKETKTPATWTPKTELGKQYQGWGTQLKPAHEPIALARKPIKVGSIARNCQTHGVGALNIDATRVPYESEDDYDTYINNLKGPMERSTAQHGDSLGMFENQTGFKAQKGKVAKSASPNIATSDRPSGGSNGWSRVGFSEQPVEKYSDQKKSTKPKIGTMGKAPPNLMAIGTPSTIETSDQPWIPSDAGRFPSNVIGEIPLYQKYFYCPKVSRKERHIGHETPPPMFGDVQGAYGPDGNRMAVGFDNRDKVATEDKKGNGLDRVCETCGVSILKPQDCSCDVKSWVRPIKTGNNHPTVKPIELMKYLIKLITPPGGTVLDPFNGSGSTGCAAVELGHPYIGCELDPAYVEIAQRRIEAWYEAANPTTFNRLFEVE